MFTINDFKVRLVNGEEVKNFVKRHGEFSKVCYDTPKEKAEKVGEHCLESGHLSGSRHLYMVFEIKNVPRSAVDQLVRHTQGFVTNVQSLRYCNKDGKVSLYAAPEIEKDIYLTQSLHNYEAQAQAYYDYFQSNLKNNGYTNEQANEIARTVIPIGVATECNIAVNIECLIHLANVRLCTRAELPIRTIVKEMVRQVLEVEPRYKPFLVPNCKKLGYCPEGKDCK
jgi:thymidylate synthase (FAD)|nr:MAG TPA: Thymidylate synthase complementing protein [Caudoviricetes sp.]